MIRKQVKNGALTPTALIISLTCLGQPHPAFANALVGPVGLSSAQIAATRAQSDWTAVLADKKLAREQMMRRSTELQRRLRNVSTAAEALAVAEQAINEGSLPAAAEALQRARELGATNEEIRQCVQALFEKTATSAQRYARTLERAQPSVPNSDPPRKMPAFKPFDANMHLHIAEALEKLYPSDRAKLLVAAFHYKRYLASARGLSDSERERIAGHIADLEKKASQLPEPAINLP